MRLNGSPHEPEPSNENAVHCASDKAPTLQPSQQSGIVYVLTNPAMPDMVKIGSTRRDDVAQRLKELYSTGVPVPFRCEVARSVNDYQSVEAALHTAFEPYRVNPKREFFEIEIGQAQVILELLGGEDVTPTVKAEGDQQIDAQSLDAEKRLDRRKRPPLDFRQMGIPIGAQLVCNKNDERAEVVSARTVRFRNVETSLSQATKVALQLTYTPAPCPQWAFNGRSLSDIYNETYGAEPYGVV